MISKSRIKFVQSLHKKKYRQKYGQFTVEGAKSVGELLHSNFRIKSIFCTQEWLDLQPAFNTPEEFVITDEADLQRISFFATASPVIAIAEIPTSGSIHLKPGEWIIALDGINDPGNLGTIIRIADWYGIKQMICSKDTVDLFNPKTISSTMGSFARVQVDYCDLSTYLKTDIPVYFCEMEGETLHTLEHIKPGIIVIGSEAHGIRTQLQTLPHRSITIKRIGEAESLNAAIATGIICDRLIMN
ncbi:MAG: RNA methyltransferase [Bacteroidetes bacterium]|nr:RNA methyltransferase [Bacteroidota bacterium]